VDVMENEKFVKNYFKLIIGFMITAMLLSSLHLSIHTRYSSEKVRFYGYGKFIEDGERDVTAKAKTNYKFWGVPEPVEEGNYAF